MYVTISQADGKCLAIRLIHIKLQVTRIEPAGSRDNEDDDYDPDGDNMDWSRFQGQRLPVVYFRGSSRSLQPSYDGNANSKIRGMRAESTSKRRKLPSTND